MKWFSLLAVSLMSLCSIGSAKDQATKAAPVRTNDITVQYTPATQVNLVQGLPLTLGTVTSVTKRFFTLSSDDTMIQIKKSGSYFYNFNLLLSSTQSLPTNINVEISPDGVSNWTVVTSIPVTPNIIYHSTSLPLALSSSGFFRLTIGTIGTPGDLFLAANMTDLTLTITRSPFQPR